LKQGDKNVAYVDGSAAMGGRYANAYTVDGVHPNDAGFLRLADAIGREVETMLRKNLK
jgi:prepilin-type processing-associated H-X9-DG protein